MTPGTVRIRVAEIDAGPVSTDEVTVGTGAHARTGADFIGRAGRATTTWAAVRFVDADPVALKEVLDAMAIAGFPATCVVSACMRWNGLAAMLRADALAIALESMRGADTLAMIVLDEATGRVALAASARNHGCPVPNAGRRADEIG